jgi:hypothetical protein
LEKLVVSARLGVNCAALRKAFEEERGERGLKIWRYIDLAKFVNMLATGTLYFPCATTG